MRVIPALLLLAGCCWTAEEPAQVLFDKVRERVLANIAKVPKYTCVETVNRTQHHLQFGGRAGSCSALIAAREHVRGDGLLMWHDRLRMDVAVGDRSEMYSWAGASRFETNEMDKLALTGSTGTGAFSSFLTGVFGGEPERFVYRGIENQLAVFEYTVPLSRSHYSYRGATGGDSLIPYNGRFYVSPAGGELRRLTAEGTQFTSGDACRVVNTLDYRSVKIGSGEFILPEVSTMTVLYDSGDESVNETRFSSCHEYVGESTIRFDDDAGSAPAAEAAKEALQSLPPKTRVRVRLEKPVDSDSAAAGDAVVGLVERDSKALRKNDRLHGRILRLEQFMTPSPHWIVAIRFDSVERDGIEAPVTFKPVDDGDRTPTFNYGRMKKGPLPTEPKGAGIYSFDSFGKLVLDSKFKSEWEVSAK